MGMRRLCFWRFLCECVFWIPQKGPEAKKGAILVLDPKRSNAINIGMTVLPALHVIKAAILNFDEFAITKEGIEVMRTAWYPQGGSNSTLFIACSPVSCSFKTVYCLSANILLKSEKIKFTKIKQIILFKNMLFLFWDCGQKLVIYIKKWNWDVWLSHLNFLFQHLVTMNYLKWDIAVFYYQHLWRSSFFYSCALIFNEEKDYKTFVDLCISQGRDYICPITRLQIFNNPIKSWQMKSSSLRYVTIQKKTPVTTFVSFRL